MLLLLSQAHPANDTSLVALHAKLTGWSHTAANYNSAQTYTVADVTSANQNVFKSAEVDSATVGNGEIAFFSVATGSQADA